MPCVDKYDKEVLSIQEKKRKKDLYFRITNSSLTCVYKNEISGFILYKIMMSILHFGLFWILKKKITCTLNIMSCHIAIFYFKKIPGCTKSFLNITEMWKSVTLKFGPLWIVPIPAAWINIYLIKKCTCNKLIWRSC